jgi:hypothetical protein
MHTTDSVVLGVVGAATASVPSIGAAMIAVEEQGLTTPTAIIIGAVLAGITVPLLRWVLGRLDKSLEAQQKFNKSQSTCNENLSKAIALLISEQREKRRENAQHHDEVMQQIEDLREALEDNENEQRIVPSEAPKEH